MAGTLTFIVDDTLREIVAHARSASERRPSYSELYDPACRKDGKVPPDDVFPTSDDIDMTKVSVGLWLVKDQGVYLMSPGTPPLQKQSGDGNLVAYAIEADPKFEDEWYDVARQIMGGDDCVEKIDLDFFERAIADRCPNIYIDVTEQQISIHA